MKAAKIHSKGAKYTIEQDKIPRIQKDTDIIIQIKAAGLCHTDFMVVEGAFGNKFPIIGSHEPVGIVHEVGKAVKDFQKGDRVGSITFQNTCGQCADCKAGMEIYCDKMGGMAGITTDGGFAEYMRADSNFCLKLPDNVPFAQLAPLMCAGATIWGAIKKSGLKEGDVLGIVGLGGLGHIGIGLAKCIGLKVVAIDVRDDPLNMVKGLKYPPDLCIDASKLSEEDAIEQIAKIEKRSPWRGLDAVIIATDKNPGFLYGSKITRKHGRMVVVGQPEEPIHVLNPELIFRDITIVGSLLSNTKDAKEMLELIGKHQIPVDVKEYKLEQMNEMIEDFHKPNMKGRFVVTM